MLQHLAESYVAQYPVNQRIEAGEPVVSKHNYATVVQWSDKECQVLSFPGREVKLQVKGLRNGRVRCSVYETKLDWWNAIGREMLSLDECSIYERVRQSGIHKGLEDHIREHVSG